MLKKIPKNHSNEFNFPSDRSTLSSFPFVSTFSFHPPLSPRILSRNPSTVCNRERGIVYEVILPSRRELIASECLSPRRIFPYFIRPLAMFIFAIADIKTGGARHLDADDAYRSVSHRGRSNFLLGSREYPPQMLRFLWESKGIPYF